MADGGYQGNREVIMPYRRPRDGVHHATRGIALMRNLATIS